jgi:3D (Asp-Asp-Asp) domain-containing protein
MISNAANENQTEQVAEKMRPPVQENGQTAANTEANAVPSSPEKPESTQASDSQPAPVSPAEAKETASNSAATPEAQAKPEVQATDAAPVTENKSASSSDSAPTVVESIVSKAASIIAPAPRTVTLTVVVDGKSRRAKVPAELNVFQALGEAEVELEKLDRVYPDPKTPVREGLTVRVDTVREKLEERSEAVAGGFKVQLTTQIAPGREQLLQYAKSGSATVSYKAIYVGGKFVRRTFVSREVEVPAQDKILAVGVDSRFMPHAIPYHKRYARAYQMQRQLSARSGSPRDRMAATEMSTLRPVKTFIAHTSGYSAGPAGGSLGNWTATGMRCVRGAVATDPRVIPLGTKMYIEGYGYAFACDTGGAIKGNRIDLAFNSPRECFQHGRRKQRVWILGP